jgi:quercetin dioxygenase-like cupin family protein
MSDDREDLAVVFDDAVVLAYAELAAKDAGNDVAPGPDVKRRLLARLTEPPAPKGFAFRYERDNDWAPHPLPGIRMKVLALDRDRGCATIILDVAPGARFPAHHHTGGAEECYVISGSLFTCGRRLRAGDFVHADAETDHTELWTDEGCRVLLVVPPEDYFPAPPQ